MWRYWAILPGAVIVLFTLREVFRDLFHPSETGSLSDFVARLILNIFRRRPKILTTAGPLSVVVVIFSWASLISFGFALIYWAVFPGNFNVRDERSGTGLWTMIYFSVEMLTTLGLGDYAPLSTPVRLIVVFEALAGTAILTASVSSIVLIYAALGRMRALARRVSLVIRAERETGLSSTGEGAERTIETLAFDAARTRVDLIHLPIVYYFTTEDKSASLASTLPYLKRLAERGAERHNPEAVRRSAAALRIALRDLAHTLAVRFVDAENDDCDTVFRAYARDHAVPEES